MADTTEPRKRFRLRRLTSFSLRTALIAMTVLAIWLGMHMRSIWQQRAAIEAIQRRGGSVRYAHEGIGRESTVPRWLLEAAGPDHFHSVVSVQIEGTAHRSEHYDEVYRHLTGLPKLKRLWVGDWQLTNRELKYIGQLSSLQSLAIREAYEVTDEGVVHLANLEQLEHLSMTHCQLTDESLRRLRRLPKLEELWLPGNRFTDDGLEHVQKMTQLRILDLRRSHVTREGLSQLAGQEKLEELWLSWSQIEDKPWLQERLPNCKIRL